MTGETFGREFRITNKRDFRSIQRQGRYCKSANFTLVFRDNQLGVGRLGITASRKVGSAVKRNRIKRLLREFFRRNLPLKNAGDLVVVVKRGIPDLTYGDVEKELVEAMRKK